MRSLVRVLARILTPAVVLLTPRAWAVRGYSGPSLGDGGGVTVGLTASMVLLEQSMMNDLIHRANSREGGISNAEMGTPYEFAFTLEKRSDQSQWGYQLRPSYFMQNSHGSGAGGSFKYEVNGEIVFLNFRRYLLENESIHLFGQFGVGYGHLRGLIEENNKAAPGHGRVGFGSDALGLGLGMGAEVCSESSQCFTIQGMYRYLKFNRAIVTGTAGAFDTSNGSLSQYGRKEEIEFDNQDLALQMGGLIFELGYAYRF